jgi:hypothetical protein
MPVVIKTDNKWRNILTGYELPEKVWKDFDYLKYEEFKEHSFIRYKGEYYDLGEFMHIDKKTFGIGEAPRPFMKWDGYMNDTYFSGIVIKISSDGERYKVGRFYS